MSGGTAPNCGTKQDMALTKISKALNTRKIEGRITTSLIDEGWVRARNLQMEEITKTTSTKERTNYKEEVKQTTRPILSKQIQADKKAKTTDKGGKNFKQNITAFYQRDIIKDTIQTKIITSDKNETITNKTDEEAELQKEIMRRIHQAEATNKEIRLQLSKTEEDQVMQKLETSNLSK